MDRSTAIGRDRHRLTDTRKRTRVVGAVVALDEERQGGNALELDELEEGHLNDVVGRVKW